MMGPSPTIVLYSRDGCESCAETRELLLALLEERAYGGDGHGEAHADIEVRDVETDPAWEAAFGAEVPVVEIGDRRLPLATSAMRLRRFLAETLDPLPAR